MLEEVVAAWVQAEVDSPFFRSYYPDLTQADQKIIDRPDFNDPAENSFRRALISSRDGILNAIPGDTEWWVAEMDQEHLAGLFSSSYPSWEVYSSGTGRLLKVAQAIRSDTLPSAPDKQVQAGITAIYQHVKGILGALAAGGSAGALILLARDREGPFTVIEGTKRATALCWRHCLDAVPCPGVSAFVGITSRPNPWLSPHAERLGDERERGQGG